MMSCDTAEEMGYLLMELSPLFLERQEAKRKRRQKKRRGTGEVQ